MKKRIMSMVLLSAILLGCMTGCGEEKKTPDNIEDAINSMSDEELESAIIDGANKIDSENTNSEDTTEQPEEIVYEATDEIINASLDSGLIQINNDVFQQGGYMTVAELAAQYSDKYEITYKDGTYEERKDHLIEYTEQYNFVGDIGKLSSAIKKYSLLLTPKYGSTQNKIYVYIGNMTNPDEKITLEKAQILVCEPADSSNKTVTPVWSPAGILVAGKGVLWEKTGDLKSSFADYNKQDVKKFLEGKGYTQTENLSFNSRGSDEENWGDMYVIQDAMSASYLYFYCEGEPNSAGKTPIYSYQFSFNPDTDKIDSIKYTVQGIVE